MFRIRQFGGRDARSVIVSAMRACMAAPSPASDWSAAHNLQSRRPLLVLSLVHLRSANGFSSLSNLISSPFAVAGFLLVLLLACHEVGYRLGCRVKGFDDDYKRRVDMIRTAILALVTFLIGFS